MKTNLLNILKALMLIAALSAILIFMDSSKGKKDTRILKLALIQYNDSPLSELSQQGIMHGLVETGMKAGVDYTLDVLNAQGDISTLNIIIDKVLSDKPDLIFVTSTPTLQLAAQKIKDLPVVFSVVADPAAAGVCNSFTDHQDNITGISTMGDYEGMVRIINQILPGTKTIGTIFTPGEANSVKNMNALKKHSEQSGIKLITTPVNSSSEIADAALALAEAKPDIICQVVDNLTSSSISNIIKIADDNKIPLFGFVSDQSEKGAVIVVSRDYQQAGIDAVKLAKRYFDGEPIKNIPIEFVSKTNILINKDAAKVAGINIPKDLEKKWTEN
ncbi:MAG: ABC transporter substrate-binding protein [Bacteroidales bacterium]|nr:ABC transporter substrate-binding protein [Bacteroidales bacterium]